MEFKASTLRTDGNMPVMVLNGKQAAPFYINPCAGGPPNRPGSLTALLLRLRVAPSEARSRPSAAPRTRRCDVMKLAPQTATFSVEADRPKVLHVVNELYAAKAERFLTRGDLTLFRIALLFRASSTAACEWARLAPSTRACAPPPTLLPPCPWLCCTWDGAHPLNGARADATTAQMSTPTRREP